ncbi:MAG: glycosyltransferase family 2 protein [Candidatus Hodarchaeales archaeon]|jgi:GT2 family glycosyltransferase
MEKLVSVIILNYNSNTYTLECLESLKNQLYKNFEILLVDNGSKLDAFLNLKEELKKYGKFLNVKLIRSEFNLYFGAGNNKAIRLAKGEYICLLNNDTEVMPNFIKELVSFLEKNPQAGLVSPKIKLFSRQEYIWTTGGQVNFRTSGVVVNRGFFEYDPDDKNYNNVEIIDFAPGTAVFVRSKYLEEIGLMDEIFFMYWEDPDWNFRAKKKGYESYYVPRTIVYHKIPINKEISNKRALFNDHFFKRNKQIIVWKYATLTDLIIFYVKFYYQITREFYQKLKKKAVSIIYLNFLSLWQGFRIGLRRRTNRTCRKYLIKDFRFIQKLQSF